MRKNVKLSQGFVYFWFAANNTSGSGEGGTSPTFAVRESGAAVGAAATMTHATPTASIDLLTHADFPLGCYELKIPISGQGLSASIEYGVFSTLAVDSQNPSGFVGSFTAEADAADLVALLGSPLSETTAANLATNLSRWLDANDATIDAAEQHVGANLTNTQNNQIGYRLGLNRTTATPTIPGNLDLNKLHIGDVNDAEAPLKITTGPASTSPALEVTAGGANARAIRIASPVGNAVDAIMLEHAGGGALVEHLTASEPAFKYTGVTSTYIDDNDHQLSPAMLFQALENSLNDLGAPPPDAATERQLLQWLKHLSLYELFTNSTDQDVKNGAGATIGTAPLTKVPGVSATRGKFT